MSDDEKTIVETTGETLPDCVHELKQTGPHWTCMLCGERPLAAGAVSEAPIERVAPTEPAPAPAPRADAFKGLNLESSDEEFADAQAQLGRTISRHEKANREAAAEGYDNAVDEHVDKVKRVGSLLFDFLGGD